MRNSVLVVIAMMGCGKGAGDPAASAGAGESASHAAGSADPAADPKAKLRAYLDRLSKSFSHGAEALRFAIDGDSVVATVAAASCGVAVSGLMIYPEIPPDLRKLGVTEIRCADGHTPIPVAKIHLDDSATVTVDKIAAAFQENEIAAEQTYGGKPIVATGAVSEVRRTLGGQPEVVLATKIDLPVVAEHGGPVTELAQLKRGDPVTAICFGGARKDVLVTLTDCLVLADNKVPKK